MSVVIISADSFCKGKEIAEMVAGRLHYKCIGREIMIAEAAQRYRVPKAKLSEAMEDSSSLLDILSNTQTRHLAYIQATFLSLLDQDQTVFHGQSEHLFIEGVSHVLKVRVLADFEERVRLKAGAENISEKKAREGLLKESTARKKRARLFYGVDETAPALFDLVLDVSQIGPAEAAAAITDMAQDIKFQTITYSIKCMKDMELSSRVRAALIDSYPDIIIQAKDGTVSIESKVFKKRKKDKLLAIKQQIENMNGVSYMEVL